MSPLEVLQQENAPFRLELLAEHNNGQQLYLLGRLRSEREWQSSEVLARVVVFKDGEQREAALHSFSEILGWHSGSEDFGDRIEAEQVVQFALAIDAADITDYQLELLWGEEAAAYVRLPSGPELELRNVVTNPTECATDNCPQTLTIVAELYNAGTAPVATARLGAGFVWVPNEETPLAGLVPEEEEILEIAELNLAPGESRSLQVAVDREIPQSEKGRYEAILRIIDFDANKLPHSSE